VELVVYNALGQEVRRLVDGMREPGNYIARWDGTDRDGNTVSGGLYLYRLRVNGFVDTKKMLFMK
jgi:flagellar hook assembly protein FlgD